MNGGQWQDRFFQRAFERFVFLVRALGVLYPRPGVLPEWNTIQESNYMEFEFFDALAADFDLFLRQLILAQRSEVIEEAVTIPSSAVHKEHIEM